MPFSQAAAAPPPWPPAWSPPPWRVPPPRRRPPLGAVVAIVTVLLFQVAGALLVSASRAQGSPGHRPVTIPSGDPLEAMETLRDSVVQIGGNGCGGSGAGTGFVVADGLIATNAHVVAGRPEVAVSPRGLDPLPGRVVAFDWDSDVALVEVGGLTGAPLVLSGQGATEGQAVASAGFGGGRAKWVKDGVVRFRGAVLVIDTGTGAERHREMLGIDMATVPGDSGSPVVDGAGQVVAIVFGGVDTGGRSFATDIAVLERLLDQPVIGTGLEECSGRRLEIHAS